MLATVDGLAWTLAVGAAWLIVFTMSANVPPVWGMLVLGVSCSSSAVVLGAVTGLHRGRHPFGSFDEAAAVTVNFVGVAFVQVFVTALFEPHLVPTVLAPVIWCFALTSALGPRFAVRLSMDSAREHGSIDADRVIVFGAGNAGQHIVRAMHREPNCSMVPVAFVDDDQFKRSRVIDGVRVLGDRTRIPELARGLRADALLVAVPSAPPLLKQEIAAICESIDLPMRILPPLAELVGARLTVDQIRDVSEEDLLGRPQVVIDVAAIMANVRGRRVLVTGAGGSIGSEICRQILAFAPGELIMVDRDESALHAVQLSIEGRALLSDPNLIVADIRDRERIHEIFADRRPEVVFHAAALKHLPLLEMYPAEAIKTNVLGTQHLLDAAAAFEVCCFVNISTDKAADPISVLGQTKRLAEGLTAGAAEQTGHRFVSVRFGNVIGSRGSALTTFRAQIEAGGPVTVTDPEATRYFMTVAEAAKLVLQAAAVGLPGEVLILDMGEPVAIVDIVRRLIARSGRDIEIVYTGLRPGEKLHEQLVGGNEKLTNREHPLVFHTTVTPIHQLDLARLRPETLGSYVQACGADVRRSLRAVTDTRLSS